MRKELEAVGIFLTTLLMKADMLNSDQVNVFVERAVGLLQSKYKGHWYPDNPTKGQAFRCIRVNGHYSKDPELLLACIETGVQYCYLGLPAELTVWVDPGEVSCRYSEDTPPFTLARFIGDDDNDDDDVLLKVSSALEKVAMCHHLENLSDDGSCAFSHAEYENGLATPPSEPDSDYCTASSESLSSVTSSPEHHRNSLGSSPQNKLGGATAAAAAASSQNGSTPSQPLLPLSWGLPTRAPVEPRPCLMLDLRVRPMPTVRPRNWSRPAYQNPMWNCPPDTPCHRRADGPWPLAGNEGVNFSRPLSS